CNGQCDWITIGAFGLHGVNGNLNKLTNEDPGSSGCIRHSDEDISFLYETLDPSRYEIRYYVFDN
ncbi:MAG TPA: L,D-transpeptidase, partial [Candidatus Nitrosocosmicus sp.]|nr:L,D-transpeptidase [Candidatus Nitrosocosmicus sp.]